MAEGSFANDGGVVVEESIPNLNKKFLHSDVVVEEGIHNQNKQCLYMFVYAVHLRKRKSEHGKLKSPSTSAITYWQIEKDKEPLSGMNQR